MAKSKNQKSTYFTDENIWKSLEKIAKNEDRSVNYILQRAAETEIKKCLPKTK